MPPASGRTALRPRENAVQFTCSTSFSHYTMHYTSGDDGRKTACLFNLLGMRRSSPLDRTIPQNPLATGRFALRGILPA
jgi:hypothetical protein